MLVQKAQALDWNFNWTASNGWSSSGTFAVTDNTVTGLVGTISYGSGQTSSITLLPQYTYDGNDNYFDGNAPDPYKVTFNGLGFSSSLGNISVYSWQEEDAARGYWLWVNSGQADVKITSFNVAATAAEVPFDFDPASGAALGVPLFIGLRYLKKRVASKKLKFNPTGTVS